MISDILSKYGSPSYVFDIDVLINRVNYLKSKFGDRYGLVYAVKANSFITKYLEDYVERFEICSPGEYEICDNLKIASNKMVISGVYKDLETMDSLIKNNSDILRYTIESVNQYNLLVNLAKKYNRKINILIRLNSGGQFGITKEEAKDIIKNNDNDLVVIKGIEYFSGTQKSSLEIISKEFDSLLNFIKDCHDSLNFEIEEVEYGPGLPIFYYQNESFDEDSYLVGLKEIFDRAKCKVSLEIGRGIAASCGKYLTKVVDMKTNKFGNYVILDGGINHLVYYGQVMAIKIPHYEIISKQETEEVLTYNLCGSLCTTNDFLVKNLKTKKLNIGDVFVFLNVGAYSVTEGISLFLSRDLPKVILIKDGIDVLARDKVKTSKFNFPEVKE